MTRIKKVHDITVHGVGAKTVTMLVSAFGNVDFQGDRVVKGAFDKSIQKWRDSGRKVPFIWSHDWNNPMAHIGTVDPFKMRETQHGLVVEAELDEDTDFAKQVLKLLRERRVTEASFAYDVVKERTADDKANELLELDIIECGPTLKGANSRTELLDVKSAQALFEREAQKPDTKAVDRFVRWGEEGWHDRHVAWMMMDSGDSTRKADTSRLIGQRKTVRCTECGKSQTVTVRAPVRGTVVPWVTTPCCNVIFGYSGSTSTEQHIKEMAVIREHVGPVRKADPSIAAYKAQLEEILRDWSPESRKYERVGGHSEIREIQAELARLDPGTKKYRKDISDRKLEEKVRMDFNRDIINLLDRLDRAGKHTVRVGSDAAANACRDAADVADQVRESITVPTLDRTLLRAATELRQIAQRLVETEGEDRIAERSANNALQRAEELRGVATILRARAEGDSADRLERAAAAVTAAVDKLASHRLDPLSVELPKSIPQLTARLEEVHDPAPAPVDGDVVTVTIEQGRVTDSTITQVAGEGETSTVAINSSEATVGDEFRLELDDGATRLS